MKERPILFSGPMVRGLLDGSKTQTRRVVKPQPPNHMSSVRSLGDGDWQFVQDMRTLADSASTWHCPYGQPGSQLWVRETFGHFERNDTLKPGDTIYYRADGECLELQPWRPSIHMPRWASRITLEITGVRVERLQDISEADAMAEGIAYDPEEGGVFHVPGTADCCDDSAIGSYRKLWESINGPGRWEANPWVWVVEFKRMEGGAACS